MLKASRSKRKVYMVVLVEGVGGEHVNSAVVGNRKQYINIFTYRVFQKKTRNSVQGSFEALKWRKINKSKKVTNN